MKIKKITEITSSGGTFSAASPTSGVFVHGAYMKKKNKKEKIKKLFEILRNKLASAKSLKPSS